MDKVKVALAIVGAAVVAALTVIYVKAKEKGMSIVDYIKSLFAKGDNPDPNPNPDAPSWPAIGSSKTVTVGSSTLNCTILALDKMRISGKLNYSQPTGASNILQIILGSYSAASHTLYHGVPIGPVDISSQDVSMSHGELYGMQSMEYTPSAAWNEWNTGKWPKQRIL